LQNEDSSRRKKIEAIYICDNSTSQEVSGLVKRIKPDFVFIDGDHGLKGVLLDHLLVRDHARIIVHHDVVSHSCPDTALHWDAVKKLERHDFEFFEFVEQYDSVKGSFQNRCHEKKGFIAASCRPSLSPPVARLRAAGLAPQKQCDRISGTCVGTLPARLKWSTCSGLKVRRATAISGV
jgi:hypothetical protein